MIGIGTLPVDAPDERATLAQPPPPDLMRREPFGEPSAVERVLAYVSSGIRRGRFRPGTRMPSERELAEMAGVSRPTMRAALRTLAASGLVRVRHGAGTFVTAGPASFDTSAVDLLSAAKALTSSQILEARRALELAAAQLAATHASGDQVALLADHVSGMFESVDSAASFERHDTAFHRLLAEASGNALIGAVLGMLIPAYFKRRHVGPRSATELRRVAELHREIYLAVRGRDGVRALRAMSRHMADTDRA